MGSPTLLPHVRTRFLAVGTTAALIATLFAGTSVAAADTRPAESTTPATVSTDSLPTVQIDGIVWSQVVVGTTVYAGGSFATAQPAGAAEGVNTVPRANLLAYNIETGNLITSFAPTLNGEVRSLAVSPDGKRVYAGGIFTEVNGTKRNRIAAFDTATGQLVPGFAPSANAGVSSVVATNDTVYFGGTLTSVSDVQRPGRSAAVKAQDGSVLPWAPVADTDGRVTSMVISPDGAKLVLGGSFVSMNGSDRPGYGMAAVDAVNGTTNLPWNVNNVVRNGGSGASITSLTSDGTSVYGTGYVFKGAGNLEGAFRADWKTGDLVWLEDCHGDSYGIHATNGVAYIAGHPHYCGNVHGGFPQTSPWTIYRGLAFTDYATGTLGREPLGYFNFEGNPSPSLLHFYPEFDTGAVSGANQGPWTVTGSNGYLLYGGEFTRVNNKRQQGLARFATTAKAPNADGPRAQGSNWVPDVVSLADGSVRVAWRANYDRDNASLSYRLIRDGVNASPIYTTAASSSPWDRPSMSYLDTDVAPGATHTYRVRVEDPLGNVGWSSTVTATVNGSGPISDYAKGVLADRPEAYWRLNETSGTTVYDWSGMNPAYASGGVTRGAAGAIANDTNTASTFSGATWGLAATKTIQPGPNDFAIEGWFKTTTTRGGKIIGFGNKFSGESNQHDRHVYMDDAGRVFFGVNDGGRRTLNTAAGLNDGQWHHVVANLGSTGMQLYVDGALVGERSDAVQGQAYNGFWRIGGDTTWAGTSMYFGGAIDDVAIYRSALTADQVRAHYALSGRDAGTTPPPPPPAPSALAADSFERTVASGLGAADTGGNWTLGSASTSFSVSGGAARLDTPTGSTRSAYLAGITAVDADVQAVATHSRVVTGTGAYISLLARKTSAGEYIGKVKILADGAVSIQVTRGGTSLAYANVPALRYAPGDRVRMRVQAVGSSPTTVRAKVWADGTAEPADWQVTATDSTAGLQQAGYSGIRGNLSSAATATSVFTFDDFTLRSAGATAPPANVVPTASMTTSVDGLSVSANGSASKDPDGSITSHAWTFGDGGTATGAIASHTYAAAGTYTVTLTVTDNAGATAKTTSVVEVAAPPASAVLASDAFERVAVNSLGTADAGGAWTLGSTWSAFSISNGAARLETPAGTVRSAYLKDVASVSTDVRATVTHAQAVTGTGAYVSLMPRRTAAGEYVGKVKILGSGAVSIQVTRSGTSLQYANVPDFTYVPGERMNLRVQTVGTSPTVVRAKVWRDGLAEPTGWQVSVTDSTAGLQEAGHVGLRSDVSSAASASSTFTFDDFVASTAR
ncbi:LamG-like jellyroll fold domain-containing protein [Planctomonas psychrotolerans]|uniref:LamG-like jellyroll fold domain-containing protein n=1 Tax=Planctomonas psychrotolerans TaxID=2528712 RepID=UPI001D0D1154|nr:LamG-like jellyroll fold domain-containing protein [Planctomonas psychrotolerans]